MKFPQIYIIACISLTVTGQLLVKKGVNELSGNVRSVFLYFINPYIIAGLLSAGLVAIFWIKALEYYKLSYAYPFMSLSFFFVFIFSWLFFGENISINQWIGLAIVIVGLIIGSQ